MTATVSLRPRARGISAALTAACALALIAHPASAKKRAPADLSYRTITVPSAKDPGKSITGLVRFGNHGDEVRLPDGTWVLCAVTCAVTLRHNSYDLWERRERYRWWAYRNSP